MLFKSFLVAGLAATVAAKSAVIDLIPSNFDDVVLKSGKPTLVEFFAPWCGHCKTLAPVYEELAQSLEWAKSKVQIAKVDADAEKALGKRFGVQGFPTLKFFDGKSDQPTEYNGGRDLESLTKFIAEKTGVTTKKKAVQASNLVMLTDNTFNKAIGGEKNVFVAFTAPWCGHCKTLAPIFEVLANTFANEDDVVIAKVDAEADNSKKVAKEFNIASYPTIKFFPKGSTKAEDYDGGRAEADFVEFLNIKTGTHRVAGGGLDEDAGTIEVLDELATKYLSGASLEESAAAAKKAAEGLKDKLAPYYVRVFEKLATNAGYVEKELARLEGIISKGGLLSTKVDELTTKTNILRKFQKVTFGKEEL
ncbi:thioredoxin-like protein [Schizothecium vesticola]|uniref:protein disulfide-isomerase n=1 Tax=Schizothecium vesticola TaxID=314040 RepID=A0AA40F6Y5_9PEZI|nr:thioredoxin-like protein [Schizothecium vesticola]